MDEDLRSASNAMDTAPERTAYAPKPAKKPRKSLKIPLIILASLIVLGGIGFAVWKFVINKPEEVAPITSTEPAADTPKTVADVAESPLTETYKSTALSVAFKHPKTWTVTEASGGIRIDSPSFTYTSLQQGELEGNFRVYIRQGAREVDGKYIGSGVAIKPSDKLVYTQPAVGQRKDTLLSSFGSDSSDNFSFFLIAGNFQLNKEDTLGPDYGKEADTYIVAGGYSTMTAIDDLATIPVDLDYYATTEAYKQGLAIIASLQLK